MQPTQQIERGTATRLLLLPVLLVALLLVALGCSKSAPVLETDAETNADADTAAIDIEEPQTVVVKAGEFNFAPASFKIPAGKPVKIVLENQGNVDHDLLIRDLPFSTVETEEATMSEGGPMDAMGHGTMGDASMPEGAASEDEVVHVHAMPGDEAFQVFMAHAPGTYHFACEIPGHKEAGMVGTVIVEG